MNLPDGFLAEFPLEWKMSAAEQLALIGVLARIRPDVAIEIGTHRGGSLQVLAAYGRRVHAIDCDPEVQTRLAPRFPGVRFHIGPSTKRLPEALAEIDAAGGRLEFVLVDGDHTSHGVQSDIEILLRHRPITRRYMLLHDSFNPDCRAGMRRAAWSECPYVHAVNLDFIAGMFHAEAAQWVFARSMWGGFALAVLEPEPRKGPLVIASPQESLHRIVFQRSAHRLWHKVVRGLRRKIGAHA